MTYIHTQRRQASIIFFAKGQEIQVQVHYERKSVLAAHYDDYSAVELAGARHLKVDATEGTHAFAASPRPVDVS